MTRAGRAGRTACCSRRHADVAKCTGGVVSSGGGDGGCADGGAGRALKKRGTASRGGGAPAAVGLARAAPCVLARRAGRSCQFRALSAGGVVGHGSKADSLRGRRLKSTAAPPYPYGWLAEGRAHAGSGSCGGPLGGGGQSGRGGADGPVQRYIDLRRRPDAIKCSTPKTGLD